MDYCVWGILESEACDSSHTSVEALKRSLLKAWEKIPQEKLRNAAMSFRSRLERVIRARGGHIE